jgi:hypothetical protein
MINNKEILGLELGVFPNARFLVLRKSDPTWRQVPESGDRAFGSFISGAEIQLRKNAALPESAGRAEWRQEDAPTGPATDRRLDGIRESYTGTLHLYDVATDKHYTIITNQGDNEIILVEDDTVYYRVSDRLYSAPILAGRLGEPKLLATDDLIRDAHWAFIKH